MPVETIVETKTVVNHHLYACSNQANSSSIQDIDINPRTKKKKTHTTPNARAPPQQSQKPDKKGRKIYAPNHPTTCLTLLLLVAGPPPGAYITSTPESAGTTLATSLCPYPSLNHPSSSDSKTAYSSLSLEQTLPLRLLLPLLGGPSSAGAELRGPLSIMSMLLLRWW